MSLAVSEERISADRTQKPEERKKRILFVIPSLVGGGAERVILYLVDEFYKEYEIRLIVLHDCEGSGSPDFKLPKEQIRVLGKRSALDVFRLMVLLKNEICSYQPDFAVSFLIYTNMITAVAAVLSGQFCKIILNERNYPPKYLAETRWGLLKEFFMKLTYQLADKVIANSEMTARALVSDYELRSDSVDFVHNPIDLEKINRMKDEPLDHPFFLSGKNKIIIGIGRLISQKRFDLLLRAFAMLGDIHYRLLILGQGEDEQPLKKASESLGIADRVSFVGFQKNPYAWLRHSDVFVLSSDYEGFPNVILEAMACQVPVISTNCPSGPSEIIQDGINGILVPVGQANVLAAAVTKVLKSDELQRKLVLNGSNTVQSFRIESIAKEYLRKSFL